MSPGRKLILASASPRRRQFLADLQINHEVMVSGFEERHIAGETPEQYVLRNSTEKARASIAMISPLDRTAVILGADTVVVSPENHILEKPVDRDDAARMLRMLSGRPHRVVSGFALVDAASGVCLHAEAVETRVHFRPLGEEEIAGYIASGEPFDKAGGYGVQGKAAVFVERVEGSYTNVVGMPLCEVVEALKRICGVRPFG
jgi:septum formation protein